MILYNRTVTDGVVSYNELTPSDEAAVRALVVPDGSSGPLLYMDTGRECIHTDAEAAAIRAEWAANTPSASAVLKNYAAAARYAKEISGIAVSVGGTSGIPMSTSRGNDRLVLTATMVAMGAGLRSNSATFKFADGVSRVVSNADMTTAVEAVFAHIQTAFDIEAATVASINAGTITTTAAIDAAFA
jgi:hypothetical protein